MKRTNPVRLAIIAILLANALLLSWSLLLAGRSRALETSLGEVEKQISAASTLRSVSGADVSWMLDMVPVRPDYVGLYSDIISAASAEGLLVTEVSFGGRRASSWKGLDFQDGRITAAGKVSQAVRLCGRLQELDQLIQVTGISVEVSEKGTSVGIDFRLILRSP